MSETGSRVIAFLRWAKKAVIGALSLVITVLWYAAQQGGLLPEDAVWVQWLPVVFIVAGTYGIFQAKNGPEVSHG